MNIYLSIIVPVYNTEKYLEKCLKSILSQSLKEIEVIVINDGSTDKSDTIIQKYKMIDNRVIVINKKNGGLSSARNAGIKIARGKYILNIDSDDWIEGNYFEDIYRKAEEEKLDIVVTDILWDYENKKIIYKKDLDIHDNEIINNDIYLDMFFKDQIYPAVWNKLYKRKLYKDYNILHPENVSLGEDLATTPLLALNARRIGKVNKAYIHYMQNAESLSNWNPIKKIHELIEAFNILEKYLESRGIQSKNKNEKIFNSLSAIIFTDKYDLNSKLYENIFNYYLKNLEKIEKYSGKNKKMKLYFKILKLFPNKSTIKCINFINRIGVKIKKGDLK
ncbi:MAG: glycosyltransferase family 2 protein [Cetobacterium sp.]|uniref:glycosyltransferase family 2 protein n=1 Tax=Cetobacterium sp. TaxID=2071632 RepID=UPI003F2A0D36